MYVCMYVFMFEISFETSGMDSSWNKNSAEVDIAPAFDEITTACNVGQAKKGHGACLKSGQQGFAIAAADKCTLMIDLT